MADVPEDMVAKVARAICIAEAHERGLAAYAPGADPWNVLQRSSKRPYFAMARAAIEAMMEPTEAMLAAGQPLVGHVGSSSLDAGDDWIGEAKNVWQAMIRTSLSKGGE